MKTTDITLRNQISNTFILLYNLPTPDTVYAISHAKIITGMPVAKAKTTGKYKPVALVTVMGISIPK
jgi:hypothetical protein